MATRPVFPPSDRALQRADELRKWLCKNGIEAPSNPTKQQLESDAVAGVFTNNGDKLSVSWKLKANTAYKLSALYIPTKHSHGTPVGHFEGQVMVNNNAEDKKLYWKLMDKLKTDGFRSGISVETNKDGKGVREYFDEDYTDDEGSTKTYRTYIIRIKTNAGLKNPLEWFCKLFDLIIDFEHLERIPLAQPVKAPVSAQPAKTEMPPPASAEWAPLPSRNEPDPDAEIAKLRAQLAKLEAKKVQITAEAERKKKVDEFKAKQAADLEAFMKSLQWRHNTLICVIYVLVI